MRSCARSNSSQASFLAATSFQSPTRMARLPSCSHHRSSCVHGAVAGEGRHQALAGSGGAGRSSSGIAGRRAPVTSRIVGTRSITWPGSWRSSPRAAMPLRPVDDQRRRDAPFVNPGLVAAERRVGHRRPARPQAEVRRRRAGRRRRVVAVVADHDLRAGAVVGEEKDQRVLEGAHRAELVEHPADLAVHPVDHRRVDLHLRRPETRAAASVSVAPRQRDG